MTFNTVSLIRHVAHGRFSSRDSYVGDVSCLTQDEVGVVRVRELYTLGSTSPCTQPSIKELQEKLSDGDKGAGYWLVFNLGSPARLMSLACFTVDFRIIPLQVTLVGMDQVVYVFWQGTSTS